jgi:hypothetical protein
MRSREREKMCRYIRNKLVGKDSKNRGGRDRQKTMKMWDGGRRKKRERRETGNCEVW